MAAENTPNVAISVCSICLEPYKGKNPKLLPCFHTVCLPCLKDLEQHHMQALSDTKDSQDDEGDNHPPLTFPCPTCRAAITVPPGGVMQFQSNFYLKDETLTCDICERGKEATYSCTECGKNMCDQCQRCHKKFLPSHQVQPLTFSCQRASQITFEPVNEGTVTDQLKLLEAALVTMREEEESLQRERQAVADVISRRADVVRALVTQAEDKSQRALAAEAERLGKQIQEKMITARDRYCRIWQFSSQAGAKVQLTSVSGHEKTVLLSDDDIQIYKQQRHIKTLLHQSDDCAIDLQAVEAYIGTVCTGTQLAEENISSLLSTSACNEARALERQECDTLLTSLPSDSRRLTRDIADNKDKLAALETITNGLEKKQQKETLDALKEENFNLRTQEVSLREADSRMPQTIDTFQLNEEKMREDFSNLKKEITNMQQEFQAMKTMNFKLQTDVASCQQESSLIKTETKKFQDAAEELSKDLKTFKEKTSTLVAFNARLHTNSSENGFILSEVDCNVGEAYNNTTGVFTVPVPGIYFFMARAMAAEEPDMFFLDIVVDGKLVAQSGTAERILRPGVNCTVHVVQRLRQGQQVHLSLRCEVNLRRKETSFTGMLVQPELDVV